MPRPMPRRLSVGMPEEADPPSVGDELADVAVWAAMTPAIDVVGVLSAGVVLAAAPLVAAEEGEDVKVIRLRSVEVTG